MFVLQHVRDSVRIQPHLFDEEEREAASVLQVLLDAKYANKVLPNVGLCLFVYDFVHIGTSHIFPGDGAAHTEVEFRLVVFRPTGGQVLEGVVCGSSPQGISVSLGFFNDVWIPMFKLAQPVEYLYGSGEWEWKYSQAADDEERAAAAGGGGGGGDGNGNANHTEDYDEMSDGGSEANPFVYAVGERIRCRVTDIEYTTLTRDANTGTTTATTTTSALGGLIQAPPSPRHPGVSSGVDGDAGETTGRRRSGSVLEMPQLGRQRSKSMEVKDLEAAPPPMRVVASVDEDGFGMVLWWPDEDEERQEEEEG